MGTQISPIQGFSASYFHVWHQNLGRRFEKLSSESLWEGHEDAYDVSRQSVLFDYLLYHTSQIQRTSHRIICSQVYNHGLSTTTRPHSPSWLVNKATSLSQHMAEQGFNTWYKSTTMWKTSWGLSHWETNHIKNKHMLISRRFFC